MYLFIYLCMPHAISEGVLVTLCDVSKGTLIQHWSILLISHNNVHSVLRDDTTSLLSPLHENELEVLEARLKILLAAYLYFEDYCSIRNNNLENWAFNQQWLPLHDNIAIITKKAEKWSASEFWGCITLSLDYKLQCRGFKVIFFFNYSTGD